VASKDVRRFIYRYNGSAAVQEVEEDVSGRMETPSIGSTIKRHDREWKVVHVIAPVSPNGTIPIRAGVFERSREDQGTHVGCETPSLMIRPIIFLVSFSFRTDHRQLGHNGPLPSETSMNPTSQQRFPVSTTPEP
jgi:hypothetical protein